MAKQDKPLFPRTLDEIKIVSIPTLKSRFFQIDIVDTKTNWKRSIIRASKVLVQPKAVIGKFIRSELRYLPEDIKQSLKITSPGGGFLVYRDTHLKIFDSLYDEMDDYFVAK